MFGKNVGKAALTAKSIAWSTATVNGISDSLGKLHLRSTFPSLALPTSKQQASNQKENFPNLSISIVDSYAFCKNVHTSDPMVLHNCHKSSTSVPRQFINVTDLNTIDAPLKMQFHSVIAVNNGIKYGINPTCYVALTDDIFGNTLISGLLCRNERTEGPLEPTYECMNRNARRGKRANKGKRPCSRQWRRKRSRRFGNHRR